MIYLTGDLHGAEHSNRITEYEKLSAGDTIIVLGDFGIPWNMNGTDRYAINKLSQMPYTIAFVDGNHENYTLLNNYPLELWNGGMVHCIADNILHLMRGEVYTIEGNMFLAAGGAASIDKGIRVPYQSWWPDELWSSKDTARIYKAAISMPIDYVLAHTAPLSVTETIVNNPIYDPVSDTMEQMDIPFAKIWYFGHFHVNKRLSEKYICLYNNIVQLGA